MNPSKEIIEKAPIKIDRVMELFLRALKGESLSVKDLAFEYHVSTRSITRDINNLKAFLAEHQELLGYRELTYSSSDHCYSLQMDNFLSNKELLAVTKILIGCRAFNTEDLLELIRKLKLNTTVSDRATLDHLLLKEIQQYDEIGSDCDSIIDNIWKLTECIERKNMITITYHKMSREQVKRKVKPVSILFSEYYFYLIGFVCDPHHNENTPVYFRIDRIVDIIVHRESFVLTKDQNINEGILRKKSQFMWPGPPRYVRFEFSGPSVQAVLDRIPTAKIVASESNKWILEADVFGAGIKMFLLSQGSWVKVLAPDEFVQDMKEEIQKMQSQY